MMMMYAACMYIMMSTNPPDPPLDPPLEKPPLAPPAALGGLKPYWFKGALFLATDGFCIKNVTSLNSNGSA